MNTTATTAFSCYMEPDSKLFYDRLNVAPGTSFLDVGGGASDWLRYRHVLGGKGRNARCRRRPGRSVR